LSVNTGATGARIGPNRGRKETIKERMETMGEKIENQSVRIEPWV
jgi:hypothetical protein